MEEQFVIENINDILHQIRQYVLLKVTELDILGIDINNQIFEPNVNEMELRNSINREINRVAVDATLKILEKDWFYVPDDFNADDMLLILEDAYQDILATDRDFTNYIKETGDDSVLSKDQFVGLKFLDWL